MAKKATQTNQVERKFLKKQGFVYGAWGFWEKHYSETLVLIFMENALFEVNAPVLLAVTHTKDQFIATLSQFPMINKPTQTDVLNLLASYDRN